MQIFTSPVFQVGTYAPLRWVVTFGPHCILNIKQLLINY